MTRCALLLRPSANRVYGQAAPDLALAELSTFDEHVLGGVVESAAIEAIGGVPYLVAELTGALDPARVAVLSNLSALHALFEVDGDRLRPVEVRPLRRQDDDVVTIQRYVGKTNEELTHLLVNVALAAGPGTFGRVLHGEAVRLLDPVCGRGTTLNRAIVYGIDAVGVEQDGRDLEAYETFLLGWLKDKRRKHQVARERHRKGRATPSHRTTVTYGDKDRSARRVVDLIRDDTVAVREHVPARSVDALACDLPYGVQHGSSPVPGALRRGPAELLAAALPAWRDVLRPGAGASFAWNLRTLPRADLVGLLRDAGFEVCGAPDDARFVHRVDRSITRDVLVARRPS